MTAQTRSVLKLLYEDGDVPKGVNYTDLIDSFVSLLDSGTQTVTGPLSAASFSAPSANFGAVVVSAAVSADVGSFQTVNALTANITTENVTTANVGTLGASTANITTANLTAVSAQNINIAGRTQLSVTIVSAAGTDQSGAASLGAVGITRLQGVTDGSATGFRLVAPIVGTQQVLINDTAVSANLWPSSGCAIDGGSVNAARGIPASGRVIVWHTGVSAYTTLRGT